MSRPLPPAGALLVDKPEGPTSRQVVNRVVRALGHRRVGHAGTLDPFARGLLIVAWGRATGLMPYLQEYPKSYEALARFGRITDTQDRTGRLLEERDPSGLDRGAVENALGAFRGDIRQTPPMFSAIKRDGERLYEAARRGAEVPREARPRTVARFDLLDWAPPRARFAVTCSAGTYVRTLAHDLGLALGPGASLDELTRTAIGPHRLEDALPADELDGMDREGLLARALDPAAALPDWPPVLVPDGEARAVVAGSWRDPASRTREGERGRVLDERGRLLALVSGGDPPRLLRVVAGPEDLS